MVEMLEKMMLSGLGALSLSKNKAEELLTELKDKYRLSEDEGKTLLEKIQSMAQQGKETLAETVETEVKKAIRAAGLMTREEFGALEARVTVLERRATDVMANDSDPKE